MLAVVEGAVDAERTDVVAVGGELFFLKSADAVFWIEDHHANIGDPMECTGNGTPGVARGGDEDGGSRAARGFGQVGDEAGHETGTEILEGEGRAVKKFDEVYGVIQRSDGYRKIESVPANPVEVARGNGGSEEGCEDVSGVIREGAIRPFAPEFGG